MQFSKDASELRNNNPGSLLSSDLISLLRGDILKGKYAKGDKLTEQKICSDYNISRTPVREAFHKLETEGLIETVPNRGAFVLGFSRQDARDIFDLRKSYEIQAVKWAVQRITDEEFDIFAENFEFMEFYTGKNDIGKMLNINMNFHQIIYLATHNQMLYNILTYYQLYLNHLREAPVHGVDYLSLLLEEHREIYAAIKERNGLYGAEAMSKHLDNSLARYYNA